MHAASGSRCQLSLRTSVFSLTSGLIHAGLPWVLPTSPVKVQSPFRTRASPKSASWTQARVTWPWRARPAIAQYLDAVVGEPEDVGALDVAMDDAMGVQVGQRTAHLQQSFEIRVGSHRTMARSASPKPCAARRCSHLKAVVHRRRNGHAAVGVHPVLERAVGS